MTEDEWFRRVLAGMVVLDSYPKSRNTVNPQIIFMNPKSSTKLITNPISPETSTNENPMKAYRNNSSLCEGFLPMDISNEPKITPTPTATPRKAQEATAPAINLNPINNVLTAFTLYPAYIGSVVTVGFLFNKTTLSLLFLVVNVLLLYLSLGFGIDVLVHRITLTLPLVH